MVQEIIKSAIAGITAFTATNIDDAIVLMVLFAKTNANFRPRHIVVGQYLGFTALVLASLPGFFGRMAIPHSWLGWLGLIPIAIGVQQIFSAEADDGESVKLVNNSANRANLLSAPTFQVAAITFANGGDNIGIYVSLFARSDLTSLIVILGVFGIGVGLWCFLASHLTRHPLFAQTLSRYSSIIVPFVLIGLGIFIFIDSGIYQLSS